MFDYQVSKHPHFDEACRAFALRHNLVQLAERAGMNVQILRNKLNPAQPHLLTAPEIWLLTDLTEDSTLVDGFLAQIHCLPCVPINEVAKEKLPHYVMSATAEIGRVAAGAVDALESELYRNLRPLYPKTVIRIRKGSSNGVELTGLQLDEERKQVMKIMQKVWEDDSWLH
ncbi:TPA: phage regulatory CII family protein [Escherichia coli]|nr:phage regulatory CII family protein [Escherichia coli]